MLAFCCFAFRIVIVKCERDVLFTQRMRARQKNKNNPRELLYVVKILLLRVLKVFLGSQLQVAWRDSQENYDVELEVP